MLVLCRQLDETIIIGDVIEVTIVEISGGKVRLGITAPPEVRVHRKEVWEQIQRQKQASSQGVPTAGKAQAAPSPSGPAESAKTQPPAEPARSPADSQTIVEPSCSVSTPQPGD